MDGRANEQDLPAALNPDDLVIREPRFRSREVAALEVDDLGAADLSMAFRVGSVDVPQDRIGKPARLAPPQFVQDLTSGATHRHRDGDPVSFAFAAQRPYPQDRF